MSVAVVSFVTTADHTNVTGMSENECPCSEVCDGLIQSVSQGFGEEKLLEDTFTDGDFSAGASQIPNERLWDANFRNRLDMLLLTVASS